MPANRSALPLCHPKGIWYKVEFEGDGRMKTSRMNFAIAALLLATALHLQGTPQRHSQTNSVVPVQLKGLKSLSVSVSYTDLDFPTPKDILEKMELTATKMLIDAGISPKGDQGAFLCIEVCIYPTEEKAFADFAIVQVHTLLVDDAKLVRNPMLANPHGYVTWDKEWDFLSRREDISQKALKEVEIQVSMFCSDVKSAAQYR
jgi:hypothetical protein